MRSDWDDAPDYLRNRKRSSPWRVVGVLGVVCAIVWVLLMLPANQTMIGAEPLRQTAHAESTASFVAPPRSEAQSLPVPSPDLLLQAAQPQPQPQPHSQADIEWAEKGKAIAVERARNLFSDSNYTPKQPASSYSPPSYAPVSFQQTRVRRVEREQDAHWIDKWSGGARYYARWQIIDNYIEGTSVCANHRRGSIDYRECRKGAKQFFRDRCKAYRNDREAWAERMAQRYCSAASNFNPMG